MKRIYGILRIIGLALLMLGIAMAVTLRQAEAHFTEVLSGFGQQLAGLGSFSPHSAPRRLFVNGLAVRIESLSTTLGVSDALDRFGSLCHSASNIDLSDRVNEQLAVSPGDLPRAGIGIVRQDSETDGYLGCLDIGGDTTAEGLVAHLLEFGRTQNLRSLGQLRYAMARRHDSTTTLVVLWTEGDAKLNELFPKDTDAPGRDLVGVPRPEQAKRFLSAYEEKLPYGFVAYRVEGRPLPAVVALYEALLEGRGWTVTSRKNRMILAEKDGRKLLVHVNEKRPGSVIVTLSDLG